MSTNTDTVLKLSEALTELIGAYEKLQKENDELNAKNKKLQDELDNIKQDKESIETNFQELNKTTEKQETNINSMLGKIESLLGVNKNSSNKKELKDIVVEEKELPKEKDEAAAIEESIFNVPVQHEVVEEIKESNFENSLSDINIKKSENLDISVTKVEKREEEDDNKLDLNRMASLLNGFNK